VTKKLRFATEGGKGNRTRPRRRERKKFTTHRVELNEPKLRGEKGGKGVAIHTGGGGRLALERKGRPL